MDVTERWRKGARIVAVEPESGSTVVMGGVQRRDYNTTVDRETWERIRAGYMCCECFEPWETPWPANCTGFWCPVTADYQREFIAHQYQGEAWVGPRETYEDEIARQRELRLRGS